MVVTIFGPPGSGKGTQSSLLREKCGFTIFSTGDALREMAKVDKGLKDLLEGGQLVSNEIVFNILEEFISKSDSKRILIDGLPRKVSQIDPIEKILAKFGKKLDAALFLDLDEKTAADRMQNRWLCEDKRVVCASSQEEAENLCNSKVSKRDDDDALVIKKRMELYKEKTFPMLEVYKEKNILKKIDAKLEKEKVFKEIVNLLRIND